MIVIGKFKETYNDNRLASIFDAVHDSPPPEKDKVLKYLKSGKAGAMSPSILYDRVSNGAGIIKNPVCYNDGVYAWRSDVIYYYEKYNIDLPDDFIKHVLRKSK